MKVLQTFLIVVLFIFGLLLITGCNNTEAPTALESTEIDGAKSSVQTFNTPCIEPPNGLVSWWPGDGNANDIVNGNDGTLQNDATFAPGLVGQAFSFDGVDDHVFIGNPANLQLQDFTIDAWIKFQSLDFTIGPDAIILGYGSGGYALSVAGPNTHSGAGGLNPINDDELLITKIDFNGVSTRLVIPDTDWHHVAVTKSGGTVIFYVDGVGATVPISYNPGFSFTSDIAIGLRTDTQQNSSFPGLIDEVEIFNRALSASEIQAIFNAGSAGKCKGLLIPFADFTIIKAETDFNNVPNTDEFVIKGKFTLDQNSGGIDPANEDVIVRVGTSSITIPAGSFIEDDGEFQFEGVINGVNVEMEIEEANTDAFEFEVEAESVDLTGTPNPLDIELSIGNDTGTANIRLDGELTFDESQNQ